MRTAILAALCASSLVARAAPSSLVVEAEIAPAAVYAGAEAILRLRLLRAPDAAHGVLRAPVLGDAAEMRPLEPIHWYETTRAGVTWQVHEGTYVIVPRHAGRLVVPGAKVEGAGRQADGPPLVLDVRPPPADAGEPWLPARSLALEESWSRETAALSVGTPVTRTIVVRAEGIAAERLPQIRMAAHAALRVHHDQPELANEYTAAGTTGRLVQRIVLVPLGEGKIVLPELGVRWWNVNIDAPRTATLPGRTVRLQSEPPPPAPSVEGVSPLLVWRGSAAALALLLLLGLVWHVRTQELREARRLLRAACRQNNARAARDALIQWWNAVSPGAPPPLVRRIGPAWDASANAQLDALDEALYGGRAWDGKEFWRRVRPWLRKPGLPRPAPRPTLAPLFRLQATDAIADSPIARQ